MTHTKFIISSIILCGLSNLIEQALSFVIFPNAHIFALFHGYLSDSPLFIAIFIKMLLSALIGGILGFILFPLFYRSQQINVDFSANEKTSQASTHNNNENISELPVTEESPLNIHAEQHDAISLKPDEAAAHLEKIEKKEQFEEKLSTGTFEDPNVIVENPGQALVDNPATLFDPPPNKDLQKPQMDDEDYARKSYALGIPKPGGPPGPPPASPAPKKRAAVLKP